MAPTLAKGERADRDSCWNEWLSVGREQERGLEGPLEVSGGGGRDGGGRPFEGTRVYHTS